MAGRHDEAQAASEAGLLSRRDFLDLDAVFLDPACQGVEIGFARDFESRIVHPRHIRWAENDAVAVKLVPGTQVDAAIGLAADLVQPDALDIMRDRRIEIGHPDLNVTGSQHTFQRHDSLPFHAVIRASAALRSIWNVRVHPPANWAMQRLDPDPTIADSGRVASGAKLANRLPHCLGCLPWQEVSRDRHDPSLIWAGKKRGRGALITEVARRHRCRHARQS